MRILTKIIFRVLLIILFLSSLTLFSFSSDISSLNSSLLWYTDLSRSITLSSSFSYPGLQMERPLSVFSLSNSDKSKLILGRSYYPVISSSFLLNYPEKGSTGTPSLSYFPSSGSSLFLMKEIRRLKVIYYLEDVSSLTGKDFREDFLGGVSLQYMISNRWTISATNRILELNGDKISLKSPLSSISATYLPNNTTSFTFELSSGNLHFEGNVHAGVKVTLKF